MKPPEAALRELVLQWLDKAAAERLRGADALTPLGVEARYPSDAPEVLQA
jgi:hypothetical protein